MSSAESDPRRGARLYRLLLRLYPAAFRAEFEEEMVEAFLDRRRSLRRRHGFSAPLRLWLLVGADLVRSAARERRAAREDGAGRRDAAAGGRPSGNAERPTAGPPGAAGIRARRRNRPRSGATFTHDAAPLDTLVHDCRWALRSIRRAPGFACLIVVTIAVAIGANAVIFSVVHAVLLSPLPYREPERLVWIDSWNTASDQARSSNLLDFDDWQARNSVFDGMVAYWDTVFSLSDEEGAERVFGARVSPGYFALLGAQPALGRAFRPAEADWGEHRVVVLRDSLWRRRFDADPAIIGSTLRVDGVLHTVVGVAPEGWPGSWSPVQLWVPMAFEPGSWRLTDRGSRWMDGALARLRPGATIEQAGGEMASISAALAREHPDSNGNTAAHAELLSVRARGEVRPALLALAGAVGFVLLIGCANVANLLLVRATARRREMAVRTALGASRGRVVQQLLIETLVLALLGGAAGIVLAAAALAPAVALAGEQIAGLGEVRLSAPVLGFGLALSVAAALASGIAPALRAAEGAPRGDLREDARSGAGNRSRAAMRGLMALEIALSVVLLVGAGALLRSFHRLRTLDPGFEPAGILTLQMALLPTDYPTQESILGFYERLRGELAALPGVESVAASPYELPLGGSTWGIGMGVAGEPVPPSPADYPSVRYAIVSPGYFRTLRIPLLRGRDFDGSDMPDGEPVAILNESAARRFFPEGEALGRRVWMWGPDDTVATVVGVSGDIRVDTLRAQAEPTIFVPLAQTSHGLPREEAIMLRTAGDPAALAAAVRSVAQRLDRSQPVERVEPLEALVDRSLGEERFDSVLVGVFGAVALLLSALGTYAVISYTVSRQARDFGIYAALGARRSHIARLLAGQVGRVVATGVALGVAGALGLSSLLGSLLYEVSAADPWTLGTAVAVLVAVSLLACALPARRALAADPTEAIRTE